MSGCSSGVEHNLAKVGVEGSNPFARSSFLALPELPWLMQVTYRKRAGRARSLADAFLQSRSYGNESIGLESLKKARRVGRGGPLTSQWG